MIHYTYHGPGLPAVIYAASPARAQACRRVLERIYDPRLLLR